MSNYRKYEVQYTITGTYKKWAKSEHAVRESIQTAVKLSRLPVADIRVEAKDLTPEIPANVAEIPGMIVLIYPKGQFIVIDESPNDRLTQQALDGGYADYVQWYVFDLGGVLQNEGVGFTDVPVKEKYPEKRDVRLIWDVQIDAYRGVGSMDYVVLRDRDMQEMRNE